MPSGIIKWFSPAKGYGFVTRTDGLDVYVHYTGLALGQDRKLLPGDHVEFNEELGEKGPKATDLKRSTSPEN